MYLSTLKIWNFRKYGVGADGAPGLEVHFQEGVNVLIGENDSGKTTIVDAIRYLLRTKSGETIYMDEKDFHMDAKVRSKSLKIECIFEGISNTEAAPFLEWIGLKNSDDGTHYILRVTLNASILEDGRIYPVIKAGMGNEGTPMDGQARDLLRIVYLKPLRDALQDMTHGYKSRIAQILQAHSVFGERNRDSEGKHKLENARKEQEEKETAWKKSLEETGLGTESQYRAMIMSVDDQEKLRNTLSEHTAAIEAAEKALKEQQEKLEGKDRPDPDAVAAAYQETDRKHREAIQALTLAEQKRDTLKAGTARLTGLDARIADKRKAYEEDSAFVRALRGSTGMSIQRYVLSVRLGQVIAEANRLLSGIYGGRYRLHRSNESYGSSHKSGLELEVYDSLSDQHRSVCTLSGGEKFLVALSLAIGLCTVVQNEQRGVSLEAMFIDEGFGSLDQSSLNDALDVLQTIQKGRGLVGIISHISLLEETIPTKIVTEKTAYGSKATVKLG